MWSPGFDNRVGERGKDGEDASSLLRDPFPVETLDSGGESVGEDSAHVLAVADSPEKSSTTRPNTRSTADTDAVSVYFILALVYHLVKVASTCYSLSLMDDCVETGNHTPDPLYLVFIFLAIINVSQLF